MTEGLIKAWLRALHARCNPSASADQHSAYAIDLADTLDRVPVEAFCQRAYLWVASECPKGAPNAATLRTLLGQWLHDQRQGQGISIEAERYVEMFKRRWRDGADKATLLALARYAYPVQAREVILREFTPGTGNPGADGEFEDSQWWNKRIKAIEAMQNPTARWRESMGMLELLRRPTSFQRSAAIEWLTQISNAAYLAGADTNPARVKYAPDQEKSPEG